MFIPEISGQFSIVLDLSRFYASMCVLVYHVSSGWFGNLGIVGFIHGHDAVVVFFVLSGYVISYSQRQRKRNFTQFVIARLTRLYATLLPAILITVLSTAFVMYVAPDFAKATLKSHELVRFLSSSLFIQGFWFRNLTPGFNIPLWSLCYEFSYYFFYACCFTLTRSKYRWILLIASFIIVGPTVLLLLPAWVVGVIAEMVPPSVASTRINMMLVLSIGIITFLTLVFSCWTYPQIPGTPPLNFSSSFLSDWFMAISIGVMLYSLRNLLCGNVTHKTLRVVRNLGDLTFPIYVVHYPVLVVIAATAGAKDFDNGPYNPLGASVALIVTILISIILEHIRPSLAEHINRLLCMICAKASSRSD